ncbi:unnamed protein product, partial [Owenia fusiformis]
FVRMCYFTNWAQYSSPPFTKDDIDAIDPFMCSHIIYAFANLKDNELLEYEWNDQESYSKINALKSSNAKLKTLLSVGGASNGEAPLNSTLSSEENMRHFVNQSIAFIIENGFDGINLEFSGKRNKEKFADLVTMLREGVDKVSATHPMEIAMFGPTAQDFIDGSFAVARLSQELDFVILGTFYFQGDPNTLALHTALYPKRPDSGEWSTSNTAWAVDSWMERGMPKDKIVIIVATTAVKYTLDDVTNHRPGDGATKGDTVGFQETCTFIKDSNAQCYQDNQQVGDYCVRGNTWISFDGSSTLTYKAEWVIQHGLGGIATWTLDRDDFSNSCTMGAYNLTKSWTSVLSDASKQ